MLICGLGNPGEKYKKTKHNLGFMLIDKISQDYNFHLKSSTSEYELFQGQIAEKKIFLCKPMSFMNNSGPQIAKIKNFFKIDISNILVIHDDFDLALGKIKIKTGGGDAGHNGIKSIDQFIGKNYNRLRFGVKSENDKLKAINHVLKDFSAADMIEAKILINKISENIHLIFDKKDEFLSIIK